MPHAGYYYSGLCAATAYQSLVEKNQTRKNTTIKRVIILAPSHTQRYNGIALPNYTVYQTPLGNIPVDETAINTLKQNSVFIDYPAAHATEHSLEVQLPFLQSTIERFTIVPLIIGTLTSSDCLSAATALNALHDDSTLIVVSSDFIHHGTSFDYVLFNHHILNNIKWINSQAIQTINRQSITDFETLLQKTGATICGREPIRLLLALMQLNKPNTINTALSCYYTSVQAQAAQANNLFFNTNALMQNMPDNQSEHSVSYAALIMTEQHTSPAALDTLLTGYEKKALLTEARATLENYFAESTHKQPEHLLYPIFSTSLCSAYGAFVTLTSSTGQLRGCIGRITTDQPLYKTVHDMALEAALHDSRFKPLTRAELPHITIEVSILTKPRPINSSNEIILGKHGIILKKYDDHKKLINTAVFLAHVATDFNWSLETTLEELSLKAGLPKDGWKHNIHFEVFEEIVIKEQ